MLTELDDSLWHQLPTTFDHVSTSDPRFYDRYWFAAYANDGGLALQLTMGAYSNMNVLDAACVLVRDGEQLNLRASRSLRPRYEAACGPIRVDVVEPLRVFDLTVESGEHDLGVALRWTAIAPPAEEANHFVRIRGRVSEDYVRFNQIGEVSGSLTVRGAVVELERCWGCRDHSWGVRPRIGIREPVTGPVTPLDEEGFLMALLFFSTEHVAGQLHLSERGSSRFISGVIRDLLTGSDVAVRELELRFECFEGTRRMRSGSVGVTVSDGAPMTIGMRATGPAVAMRGLGYSGGYQDGRGLGVWRGDDHIEFDTWDVSHPSRVGYPDGTADEHWHRIQPVAVTVGKGAAATSGQGSLTLIASGRLPGMPALGYQ